MIPSKITLDFKSLERHLFIANLVDEERRVEALANAEGNLWQTLNQYLEEDTGLYIHSHSLKALTYAGLYGASASTMANAANTDPVLEGLTQYDEIGIGEAQEVQTWLQEVSNSPYLRRDRRQRLSHPMFMRELHRRIFERYGARVNSLYFDMDKIEIGVHIFNQNSLNRMADGVLQVIQSFIQESEMGNTEGLVDLEILMGSPQ